MLYCYPYVCLHRDGLERCFYSSLKISLSQRAWLDERHRRHLVTGGLEPHQPHALGGPAQEADRFQRQPDYLALVGNNNHVFLDGFGVDHQRGDDFSGFIGNLGGLNPRPAPALDFVDGQVAALAEAVAHDDQELPDFGQLAADHIHADHPVAAVQPHAQHAARAPAHAADLRLFKANGLALGGDQDNLVFAAGRFDPLELVVFVQPNGDQARTPDVLEALDVNFFHRPLAGDHHQVAVLAQLGKRQGGGNFFMGRELQEVDDRRALGGSGAFGQVVGLQLEDAALGGEEQDVGVGGGGKELLDDVFFFGGQPGHALAAAALGPERLGRQPLDVAVAGQRHDRVFVRDQVFGGEALDAVADDLGPALVAVALLDLEQLGFDDLADFFVRLQDTLELLNQGELFFKLLLDLEPLEAGQLLETHLEDGDRLAFGQMKPLHQVDPGDVFVL